VPAYHLPGLGEDIATEVRRVRDIEVEVPQLGPEELRHTIAVARATAARWLRQQPLEAILAALDEVVGRWLSPGFHLRQAVEEILPMATGFSRETVREGFPLLMLPLRAAPLRTLLDAELGDCRVLDQARRGRRVVGPLAATHVLSGNLPGLAALPMMATLALKSAVIVKPAAGDPVFPALLASSIAEVSEGLGRCVVVAPWQGGDATLEDVAFRETDLVVASGTDEAIAAIAARVPGRFIGYGHKISLAAVGKERLVDANALRGLAQRLAYDVSLWDQQGCLSPQVCYVESGGAASPVRFAEHLAHALAEQGRTLPPRVQTLEDRAAVLRFRQEAEWRADEGVRLYASPEGSDWTVTVESGPELMPTCLNRCVRVKIVGSLDEIKATLVPQRRYLEAAGLAVGPERVQAIVDLLAACGVHRVCPIGTMQQPPLSWVQGGRPRIGDWVEWMAVEGGLDA